LSKSILINEQQVLACLLNSPDLLKDPCDWFSNPASICIYDTLNKLYSSGVSFSTSTIVSECVKTNKDVTHDIVDALKTKVEYDLKDFPYYKKRLLEDHTKERLQLVILQDLTAHVVSKGELDIHVLEKGIKEFQKAIDIVQQKNTKLRSFDDILPDYEKTLEDRGTLGGFMSTGNSYLDSKLAGGGIPLGQFITIFAGPGMGKSSYVKNLVNGNINKRTPLLYCPLEMGETLSMDTLCSLRTQIPLKNYYEIDPATGNIPDYVIEAFKQEKAKLLRNKYFSLVDQASLSLSNIHLLIKEAKREMKVQSLQVVVDLITMLLDARGDNKASALEDLCNGFFEILKEEKCTGIAVVQSRRKEGFNVTTYEDCKKYMPAIEEIKNSQAFEERSRAIISIFRQKHVGIRMLGESDPEVMIADDILQATILKQNLGNLATLDYLYQGDIGKIYTLLS